MAKGIAGPGILISSFFIGAGAVALFEDCLGLNIERSGSLGQFDYAPKCDVRQWEKTRACDGFTLH